MANVGGAARDRTGGSASGFESPPELPPTASPPPDLLHELRNRSGAELCDGPGVERDKVFWDPAKVDPVVCYEPLEALSSGQCSEFLDEWLPLPAGLAPPEFL